jgi:hypothetical protein
MKKPTIFLCFATWFASLVTAYYIGSQGGEPTSTTTNGTTHTALDLSSKRTTPTNEQIGPQTEESKLTAYFNGEAIELDELLREVPTLTTEQSLALLDQALALPKSDPKRASLINELLAQIAEADPMAALELATQIDSLRDYERARISILQVWGRNDPAAAVSWATTALANEPIRSRSAQLIAIFRGYAISNPEAAFQQALTMDENDRFKNRLLSEVIEAQIENGGLEAAKFAVDQLTDPDTQNRLRIELVNEWAQFDPESAANYVIGLGDEASTQLKNELIEEWAKSSPTDAAAWLNTLDPDDPTIARASAAIIQEWTRYDLAASAEWLNSLEPSAELDRAVMTYTFSAAAEDPATAMTWAESIEDDSRRTWMMERVAATWKESDAESFTEYLDSSDLTAEQRETLENAEQSRGGPGGNRGGGPGGGGGNRRR